MNLIHTIKYNSTKILCHFSQIWACEQLEVLKEKYTFKCLMLNFNHPFLSPCFNFIPMKLNPCPFLERKINVLSDIEEIAWTYSFSAKVLRKIIKFNFEKKNNFYLDYVLIFQSNFLKDWNLRKVHVIEYRDSKRFFQN